MRLLSTLSARKNRNLLIIVLTLLTLLFVSPIINYGTIGVFYNMDPEMALIGNALSFTKEGVIHYWDHPGTPSILLIWASYIPLRFFTKFVEHTNFITWAFNNISILYYYTRLVYVAVFISSVSLFLLAVSKTAKKTIPVIFAWVSLFTFSFTLRLGGTVLSETLSFFLLSVWLITFSKYITRQTKERIFLLSFLAGLAVANKYNSFPVFVISLLLPLFTIKLKKLEVIKTFTFSGIIGMSSFILGTWYIKRQYLYLFKRLMMIFFQSGSAHGNGTSSFVNPASYGHSIINFYNSNTVPSLIFIFTMILFSVFVLWKKSSRKAIDKAMIIYYFVVFASTLFIAKYSMSYYQFPNFVLLVFGASYLLSKFSNKAALLICLLVIPFSHNSIKLSRNYLINSIESSAYLEEYIEQNSTKYPTLWDYGPSKDFALLWLRDWSRGVFAEELILKRPDLLELKSDYETVAVNYYDYKKAFDVCWDKLYIREERGEVFLEKYSDRDLDFEPIGNTRIMKISSDHCATKP